MNEMTNLQVPSEIADEVRRFAAFVIADRASAVGRTQVSDDEIDDYPLWRDSDVVSLATAPTTTAANYRRIMDEIVEHEAVGRWVSIAELAEWTGEKRTLIANFRTQLYRWINAHLPAGTFAPFTAKRGDKLRPPRGREVHYRVSAECAAQWGRVRESIGGN